jgi:hypothetical protein
MRPLKKMTDQAMFQTWSELLRPQFPRHAEFTFKPRRRTIWVTWSHDAEPKISRSVAITFTNLAWKSYRGARSARRAKADQNLAAFVASQLALVEGEQDGAYEFPSSELEISVASVDLFPPPQGAVSTPVGERRAG